MKDFYEGLGILLSYATEGVNPSVEVEHDTILAWGPPPEDLAEVHRTKLERLGWRWRDQDNCWYKFT